MDEFDQESYRGQNKKKQTITMEQIILEQVKKIMELGSKEFKGGYYEESIITIDGTPQVVKTYVEDGRQAYCNAVMSLDVAASNWYARTLIDKEKEKELLAGVNKVKYLLNKLYFKYLKELKKEGIDPQEVKYRYLSDKRELCERLFSELILVIQSNHSNKHIDYDEEEENKYDD